MRYEVRGMRQEAGRRGVEVEGVEESVVGLVWRD